MKIALRSLALIALMLGLAPAFDSLSAQPGSQLPDGKQFEFWEKPLTPLRTYYVNGATGEHDWDKSGKVTDIDASFDPDTLKLTLKYPQSVAGIAVFNKLTSDYFGKSTGPTRLPGPFADANFENRSIDPIHANN